MGEGNAGPLLRRTFPTPSLSRVSAKRDAYEYFENHNVVHTGHSECKAIVYRGELGLHLRESEQGIHNLSKHGGG